MLVQKNIQCIRFVMFHCSFTPLICALFNSQVIRHYHGHLSAVFCLKLHPTLDVLITGGRDSAARIWDIRKLFFSN